ncbi:acyl carrier protein [Streptomyces albofaciens JCM 4342]|uniref:acyl carrier protein n=1 Tax=Streptomyces albofaciens TaxID=66866 RepID=UPI00123B4C42|nr:acyl carrier protein [Streptomyces albofaciens]KAA6212470.1 acyl carrier protein [Streptomyces albofaciens JCM 4342]
MTLLTIADLLTLLRECAGEEESVDLGGDVEDVAFDALGYDSLALLNTVGRIERDYGVRLGDDAVEKATTPRALIEMTNAELTGASPSAGGAARDK